MGISIQSGKTRQEYRKLWFIDSGACVEPWPDFGYQQWERIRQGKRIEDCKLGQKLIENMACCLSTITNGPWPITRYPSPAPSFFQQRKNAPILPSLETMKQRPIVRYSVQRIRNFNGISNSFERQDLWKNYQLQGGLHKPQQNLRGRSLIHQRRFECNLSR